jgi:hypothetical protein
MIMSAPILKLSNLRLGVGGQATSEDISLESVVVGDATNA